MKILGRTRLAPKTVTVTIGSDPETGEKLQLVLRALHNDVVRAIRDELGNGPTAPILPGQVHTNPDGTPKRDTNGAPIPRRNLDDANYKRAKADHEQAFAAAYLLRSAGDQVQPSIQPEDFGTAQDYYLQVMRELEKILPDAASVQNLINGLTAVASLDQFEVGEQALGVSRTGATRQMDDSGNS